MFFIHIMRYILGYVRFEIYGRYPERLINILSNRGVSVWGVTRRDGFIEACISIRDYKRLPKIKGKCRVRIHHTQTVGLFVKLSGYKERIGFAVGIAVFFLIIKVLSLYVWQIDIVGCTYVDKADVFAALERIGIHYGTKISDIDAFNIGERLVMEMPELAWAAVNVEGSLATVDISEVNIVPERDDHTPSNLKARVDGRITGHRVTDGKIMVQQGDAVVAGDLLVSGIIEYANGTIGLKHSSGEVFAETQHTVSWKENYNGIRTVTTDKEKTKYVLELFGIKIPLYLGSEQYKYTAQYEEVPLVIAGKQLPISVHKAVFTEIKEEAYSLSEEEATEKARIKLEEITKSELPGVEILTKNEKIYNQNDGILVEYLYICNENIAFEEILSISTINFLKNML